VDGEYQNLQDFNFHRKGTKAQRKREKRAQNQFRRAKKVGVFLETALSDTNFNFEQGEPTF